jgi:hypothetical protein
MFKLYPLLFFLLVLSSCLSSKQSIKFELEDGFYQSKIAGEKETIYLDNELDYLYVFPLKKVEDLYEVDTLRRETFVFPQQLSYYPLDPVTFTTHGFDVDVITIPFKYRFPVFGQPQQLSTNLNASLYTGYRTDFYSLKYKRNKLGQYIRQSKHYGLSFGAFSGFGSSPVTPWFTNDQITEEYDGLVWSNGLAVSLGIDYLNLGLAVGWDRLLDKNSSVWIYQRKPWLGLVIGININ